MTDAWRRHTQESIANSCEILTWFSTGMFAVSLFLCLLRPDPTLAGVSTPESLTLTLTLTLTMPMRKTMDMADILTLALVLTLTILVRSLPARYLRRAYRLEQHHPRLLRLCIPFDGL